MYNSPGIVLHFFSPKPAPIACMSNRGRSSDFRDNYNNTERLTTTRAVDSGQCPNGPISGPFLPRGWAFGQAITYSTKHGFSRISSCVDAWEVINWFFFNKQC